MMVIRSRGRQSKCIADADASSFQALISPTSLHLRQHRSNMSNDKASPANRLAPATRGFS